MRVWTPNPHVTLQLLQSEVTHVAGVQLLGVRGGEALGGRPAVASWTALGPGGGRACLGLLMIAELGDGVAAGAGEGR